ncbi:MAG TPA: hypothetical protein VGR71_11640 [Nitrospira sp.]|nr:hypothetical protein [Nitrospira sp.]
MRGAADIMNLQDTHTVKEYEKAFRLGAVAFCKAVRRANPDLAQHFDEVEHTVNAAIAA